MGNFPAVIFFKRISNKGRKDGDSLERNWAVFAVLVFITAAIGGSVQIVPTVIAQKGEYVEERIQQLYTPLEFAGRDIYISEGCYK